MHVRLFSLEEANRLIPVLEPLLAALADKKAEILAKQAELTALLEGGGAPYDERQAGRLVRGKEELKFIAEEFNVSLHEVSRLGCLVKDVDLGLVDFPTLHHGREAFLCWRRGEPAVAHWHGLEEGFAGRKPLDPAGVTTERDEDAAAEAGSPTYH
ncbi:MAG TPA: DUF2203 domain-containing protein [Thermodesulfobacteriota bacterium]